MILYYQIDDSLHTMNLPTSVEEIEFDGFCDFRTNEAKYFAANDTADPEDSTPIRLLLETIGTIVGGDIQSLPFDVVGDEFADLVNNGYLVQPGDELSLLRVYAHLVSTINGYKPETIPETFEIKRSRFPFLKSERFVVNSLPAARVLTGRTLTTGEAIELLEYQRLADLRISVESDDVGNIEFTLGLTEVALLMRKPGELLPSSPRELKRFLGERRNQFKKLPLSVILDLRFFLIAALLTLKKARSSGSFGKAPRGQLASPKRTRTGRGRRQRMKPGK